MYTTVFQNLSKYCPALHSGQCLSGSSKFLGASSRIIYSVGFGKHQNFNGANMFSTLHLDGLHSLWYRQGKIINLCSSMVNQI
jgi:hypothetical protein